MTSSGGISPHEVVVLVFNEHGEPLSVVGIVTVPGDWWGKQLGQLKEHE